MGYLHSKKKKESACSRFLSILIRNKFQMLLKKQSRLFICTRVFWWVALKICTTEKYHHARRWKIFWFSLNSNTPLPQEERINEEHSRLLSVIVTRSPGHLTGVLQVLQWEKEISLSLLKSIEETVKQLRRQTMTRVQCPELM